MIDRQDNGGVRIIELQRPESLNALNGALAQALKSELQEAAGDPSVRVAVITGQGSAFSAGADLDLLDYPNDYVNKHVLKEVVPQLFATLATFPKPLMLAVNGAGIGFGATILGLADIVVMAEHATISVPFSKLALVPEGCSSYTFQQRIGYQQAFWFLLSGESMSAQECLDAGLALAVVPREELMETTLQYADRLAAFPLHSLMASKKLMREHHRESLLATNQKEMQQLTGMLEHAACKEGIQAIREKREPAYGGF